MIAHKLSAPPRGAEHHKHQTYASTNVRKTLDTIRRGDEKANESRVPPTYQLAAFLDVLPFCASLFFNKLLVINEPKEFRLPPPPKYY